MPESPQPPKRYVVDVSPERVSVGDGVSVPFEWSLVIESNAEVPSTARITAMYDSTLKRAVVRSVTVERGGEGVEVTSAILREISVQRALQDSGLHVIRISEDGHEPESVRGYVHRVLNSGRQVDMQRLCTAVYRAAYTISLPPLKFVADEVGMSVSTATRWMARARSSGLAEDLITRETYNRMQADTRAEEIRRAFEPSRSSRPSGPSLRM